MTEREWQRVENTMRFIVEQQAQFEAKSETSFTRADQRFAQAERRMARSERRLESVGALRRPRYPGRRTPDG